MRLPHLWTRPELHCGRALHYPDARHSLLGADTHRSSPTDIALAAPPTERSRRRRALRHGRTAHARRTRGTTGQRPSSSPGTSAEHSGTGGLVRAYLRRLLRRRRRLHESPLTRLHLWDLRVPVAQAGRIEWSRLPQSCHGVGADGGGRDGRPGPDHSRRGDDLGTDPRGPRWPRPVPIPQLLHVPCWRP